MQLKWQCLALLVLALSAAPTHAKNRNEDDYITSFKKDYEVKTEKEIPDEFDYTLHNLTFPGDPDEFTVHERVKRLRNPLGDGNPVPLCIMTFNMRVYKAPDNGHPRVKDIIIAHVRLLNLLGKAN